MHVTEVSISAQKLEHYRFGQQTGFLIIKTKGSQNLMTS
jgi:hypothetical protein